MSRLVTSASALVLLLATAPAAPVPKGKPKTPDYFPIRLGSVWVYAGDGMEVTTVVTAVDRKKGETLATLDTQMNGKTVASEQLSVTERGVFRVKMNDTAVAPAWCVLKSPPRPGDRWPSASVIGGQRIHGVLATHEAEEVEVPAGEFKAVRVSGPLKIVGDVIGTDVTYWLAPDVGIVRLRYTVAGKDSVLELKSFTPGKKD